MDNETHQCCVTMWLYVYWTNHAKCWVENLQTNLQRIFTKIKGFEGQILSKEGNHCIWKLWVAYSHLGKLQAHWFFLFSCLDIFIDYLVCLLSSIILQNNKKDVSLVFRQNLLMQKLPNIPPMSAFYFSQFLENHCTI